MSMDKKLTAAVYAAVEKAYDHQCDIKDAADEILEIIEADRQRRGISNECEPVGYIMPTALKQLKAGGHAVVGGVSQGFDVPIYTAPQPAEPLMVNAVFETEISEIVGTTEARVKRVERQDDGSLTVVIDYWPHPAEPSNKDSDDFFTNDNPKLRGLNESVKVPSDIWRGAMTTEQERAAFKSWYANSHNSGTPWDAWKARAALAETAPCLFKALQKIASLPEYRMDEASLIATEALYEVECAARVRYGQSGPKFGEEE